MLSEDSGLHETLALLTSQLRPDSNHKEEMGFLRDVFSEKSLNYLMKIHEKLRHYERQSPTPVLHSAAGLVEDVSKSVCLLIFLLPKPAFLTNQSFGLCYMGMYFLSS